MSAGRHLLGSLAIAAMALLLPGIARAQANVLANPGFESGRTGWTESSTAGLAVITRDPAAARAGSWYAWLGGAVNLTDSIHQDVTILSGGQLTFWYRFTTNGGQYGDFGDSLDVELVNPSTGAVVEELDSFWGDDSGGWTQSFPYDLSRYAGQRLRLRFIARNNSSAHSSFRVDDVSLMGTTTATPANYTALWWNQAEPGWGINVSQQGNIAFATLFTYDSSGAPLWLVMSGGARQGTGDTFTGDLFRTTGPAFNAVPFTPISAANLSRVGTMTLAFSGGATGNLTYSVNGVTVTKPIQKQVYGARAATCASTSGSRSAATNYQDLWWNSAESGWGVNLTHQGNILFATLFTYGSTGQGMWLVMSGGTRQADGSFLGDLFRTTGPVFNAQPWTPATALRVGTMKLRFQSGESATLEYTVNGVSVAKTITRQVFSSPPAVCTS